MKKEFGIAFVRTSLVPPTAGFLLGKLVEHGIQIDSTWVVTLVSFLLSGIYYCLFHLVEVAARNEQVKKWAGIFLGYPSVPKYKEGK